MIAIIVAFLMSLLWYFLDTRKNKRPRQNLSIQHHLARWKNSKKRYDEVMHQKPLGRLYYSTPGKTYSCFIRKGRVLNTGKTWPYPPNKP